MEKKQLERRWNLGVCRDVYRRFGVQGVRAGW